MRAATYDNSEIGFSSPFRYMQRAASAWWGDLELSIDVREVERYRLLGRPEVPLRSGGSTDLGRLLAEASLILGRTCVPVCSSHTSSKLPAEQQRDQSVSTGSVTLHFTNIYRQPAWGRQPRLRGTPTRTGLIDSRSALRRPQYIAWPDPGRRGRQAGGRVLRFRHIACIVGRRGTQKYGQFRLAEPTVWVHGED